MEGIRKGEDVIKNGKKFYRVECWKEQVWESLCQKGCFGVGVVPLCCLFSSVSRLDSTPTLPPSLPHLLLPLLLLRIKYPSLLITAPPPTPLLSI